MIILKLFAYCFTALFTLTLFWALGWMWFAASVVSMKPQSIETPTDAIIVLTGGEKRVNTGLDLLAEGKAKHLFISGVNAKVKPEELVSLWHGDHKKVLCCITLGYEAGDTSGNASESQEWVRKKDIHSVRLVTSNYHMSRSSLIFEKAMPNVEIYQHPVVPDDFEPWGSTSFWKLTFQEYTKFLAMWLRFDQISKNPSLNKDAP